MKAIVLNLIIDNNSNGGKMEAQIKENIKSKPQWTRAFFMVINVIFFEVAKWIAFLVIVFQFVFTLISGKPNENMVRFGKELTLYIGQLLEFLTYNSEEKPFPFQKWPSKGV